LEAYVDRIINADRLFNLIAPVYGLFYERQKRHYGDVIGRKFGKLGLSSHDSFLDVGCGTGALCAALGQNGFSATGIDAAQKMIDVANSKNRDSGISFMRASILEGLPFEDKSFDVSIASFVAHGMGENERGIMYREMSRTAKHFVMFYDYNGKRSLPTDVIEWLEGGDYFNFIRSASREMKEFFGNVMVIDIDDHSALYVCEPVHRQ
jgi:ubiquinone/menaquinone biosynthesis C-methylase UbiE